jgi:hypothetical protein
MDLLQTSAPNQIQDRLGCYRVGDLKVYSKLEAIELHTKTGIHPHWDFNEAVFDCYDWTKEPDTPILELYRRRAQQLRDKYDYIILSFSGGADSTNILSAFTDNDIKLDEIVTYVNYEATGERDNFMNAEYFNVAQPKSEELKEKYPWIKSRVIDLSTLALQHFVDKETKFGWLYENNMFFSPNNTSKDSLPLKIKEWADMIHAGKKVCMLWGHDKPRILHTDGKFSFRFIDFIDSGPTVKSISGKQPYYDELFYWTPDLPELLIKQSHMIMNYMKQTNILKSPFISTEKSDLAYVEVNKTKYWLSNHGVHSIIYPKWDIGTFSVGKASSVILTQRDTWFFNMNKTDDAYVGWKMGIDKLFKTLPDYWKNAPNDFSKGIKACWSKDYFLE